MSPKQKFWIGFVVGLNLVPLVALAEGDKPATAAAAAPAKPAATAPSVPATAPAAKPAEAPKPAAAAAKPGGAAKPAAAAKPAPAPAVPPPASGPARQQPAPRPAAATSGSKKPVPSISDGKPSLDDTQTDEVIHAEADEPPARDVEPDLSLEEATKVFQNFELEYKRGSYTGDLYGTTYQHCLKYFKVVNSSQSSQLIGSAPTTDGNRVRFIGFSVQDEGGRGRQCVEDMNGAACSSNPGSNRYCASIHTLDGAHANFGSQPIAKVGLLTRDASSDHHGLVGAFVPFNGKTVDVTHYGAQFDAEDAAARARTGRISQVQAAVSAFCTSLRANPALSEAQLSALLLLPQGRLDEAGISLDQSALQSALLDAQLKIYEDEVRKAKYDLVKGEDDDILARVREDLTTFLENHPEKAVQVFELRKKIATRYMSLKNAGLANFKAAIETLKEAKDDSGDVSDARLANLDNSIRDFENGQLAFMAKGGLQNNMMFLPAWYQSMTESVSAYQSSGCPPALLMAALNGGAPSMNMAALGGLTTGTGGQAITMESCSNMAASVRSRRDLMQVARNVDQMNYQNAMAMNQMMSQAMYGGAANTQQQGMAGLSGVNNGQFGMPTGMNTMPSLNGAIQTPSFMPNNGGTYGVGGNFMGTSGAIPWALPNNGGGRII